MSKKALKNKLIEIEDQLKDVAAYRRLITNKQAQYIIINVKDLEKQIKFQVASTQDNPGEPLPQGLISIIEDESKRLLNRVARLSQSKNFGKRKIKETHRNHVKDKLFEMAIEQLDGESAANVFAFFRQACTQAQKLSVKRINKKIREYKKLRVAELKTTTQLVEVGHVGETENLRNLLRNAQAGLLACRTKPTSGITKFVNRLHDRIDLRLEKAPLKIPPGGGIPKGPYIVLILESVRLNRNTAELRQLAKDVRDIVKDANKLIPKPEELKGSNNAEEDVEEYIEKILPKRVEKTAKQYGMFKSSKGAKRAGKKAAKRNTIVSLPTKNVRARADQAFEFFEPVTLNPAQINTPASSVSLEVLLQARLPKTVQKNMGQPALVNRTGRFASSVRALKVGEKNTVTYTYQTNPYKVFETDSFRDPRQLIEKSIREIAAEIQVTNLNMIRSG